MNSDPLLTDFPPSWFRVSIVDGEYEDNVCNQKSKEGVDTSTREA